MKKIGSKLMVSMSASVKSSSIMTLWFVYKLVRGACIAHAQRMHLTRTRALIGVGCTAIKLILSSTTACSCTTVHTSIGSLAHAPLILMTPFQYVLHDHVNCSVRWPRRTLPPRPPAVPRHRGRRASAARPREMPQSGRVQHRAQKRYF